MLKKQFARKGNFINRSVQYSSFVNTRSQVKAYSRENYETYFSALLFFVNFRNLYNSRVATVLGLIPASSDKVESEGRQMKQCWIKYWKNPFLGKLLKRKLWSSFSIPFYLTVPLNSKVTWYSLPLFAPCDKSCCGNGKEGQSGQRSQGQ
jgi:hypothetical protein